jgi:hypothetical protein
MFQKRYLKSKRVLFILFALLSLIIPLDMITFQERESIYVIDAIAKGLTGLFVLIGIYVLTRFSASDKTFYLIFFGLAFYFYAIKVGLLEEYILHPQSSIYEIVEH